MYVVAFKGKRKVFERVHYVVYRFPHLTEHKGVKGSFGIQLRPVERGDFDPFFIDSGNTWASLEEAKAAIDLHLKGELF